VARTLKNKKCFEKGWEGGLLHPSVCLHLVFVSTPWADCGRQRQGQGQSRRAGPAAPHPDQLQLPGAHGALAALPQVTPDDGDDGLAFLGFCFCSSSAATSVPCLSLVLHALSC